MRWRVVGVLYAGALAATALCALAARLPPRSQVPACPSPTWSEDGAVTVQEGGAIVDGRRGEMRITPDGRVHTVPTTDPRHREAVRASEESANALPWYRPYNPGPPEATVRRGDRTLRVRVLTLFDGSTQVRFDDGPARYIAARLDPFPDGPLGTPSGFGPHPHMPRGVWQRLVPLGDERWLFFWPAGLVVFDDAGRRLDGCVPDLEERLRAAMPVVLAPVGPIYVRIALGLAAATPLAWLLAALRRRRRVVFSHALAWSIASLFALCLFALPLLT